MPSSVPRTVRLALWLSALWIGYLVVSGVLPAHPATATEWSGWVSVGVQLVAAVICAAAAVRLGGRGRLAWMLVAAGIAVWTLGDSYWMAVLHDEAEVPVPSPADLGYLLYPPMVLAGLIVLVHLRVSRVPSTVALDSVIVALAAATIAVAFVIQPVATGASGGTLAVVTNVAYPITDLMLLAVVVSAIALRGWRLDRTWALLGAGCLAFFVADSLYLVTAANGTYMESGLIDAGWVASTMLFAVAAWAPADHHVRQDRTSLYDIVTPVGLAFAALIVALFQPPDAAHLATLILGGACMTALMARLIMTFMQNVEMLEASRQEALTDSLTGLGNRRALMSDLERHLMPTCVEGSRVLVLFDLDGFKRYNDGFGHPAGDALLTRLGSNLARCMHGRGRAYRMGGDEFCVMIEPRAQGIHTIIDEAADALTEQGEGFSIGCSFGVVALPSDATDPAEALRLADQRMYAAKNRERISAANQVTHALTQALQERDTSLGSHVDDVAELAERVARRVGMTPVEIDRVRSAAKLHDIGKIAIPDDILHKPGRLDERERAFIRDHTVMGERIIAAAPALDGVASLVRSSQEQFNGTGYPDGLRGTEIPLGARVIAVCDRFHAMISGRVSHPAMAPEAAFAELRRCAGSQFDPVIVEVLCEEWSARPQSPQDVSPTRAGVVRIAI